MRKETKMLWRVASMASVITAVLVLAGMLVLQDSSFMKADVGSQFGEIEGSNWEQNSNGQWVRNANAASNLHQGDMTNSMVLGDSISFGVMVGYVDENGLPIGVTADGVVTGVDPRLVAHAWPKLLADQAGVEMNLAFSSTLPDNLGVPYFTLNDLFRPLSTFTDPTNNPKDALAQLVLGAYYYAMGDNSAQGYMLASDPTTVFIMIGGNDVLGAAFYGNVMLKTPIAAFMYGYDGQSGYSDLVASVASDPEKSVVVSTIPNVADLPFMLTPQEFVDELALYGVMIPVEAIPAFNEDYTPYIISGSDYITLSGLSALASGQPLIKCSNTNYTCQGHIFTQSELDAITAHTIELNNVIKNVADQYDNVAVMDLFQLFQDVGEKGIVIQGKRYTSEYRGGGITLDGIHPTMLGQAIIANEMIHVLNSNFATGINPIVLNDIAANEQLAVEALDPPRAIDSAYFEKGREYFKPDLLEE